MKLTGVGLQITLGAVGIVVGVMKDRIAYKKSVAETPAGEPKPAFDWELSIDHAVIGTLAGLGVATAVNQFSAP